MNTVKLIDYLKIYLENSSLNINDYVYRISMIQDHERVFKYGSTRIGISDKQWNRNDELSHDLVLLENVQKYKSFPLKHEDVIIASFWVDLLDDCQLENSTLKHKLQIYNHPFFTLYKKEKLLFLFPEHGVAENNQGKNFLFLDSPLNALKEIIFVEDLRKKYE